MPDPPPRLSNSGPIRIAPDHRSPIISFTFCGRVVLCPFSDVVPTAVGRSCYVTSGTDRHVIYVFLARDRTAHLAQPACARALARIKLKVELLVTGRADSIEAALSSFSSS